MEEEHQELEEAPPPEKPLRPKRIIEYYVKSFDVMFVSLGLILLAFFIALNAMAVIDEKKKRDALGSLMGEFGMLPEGIGVHDEGAYVSAPENVNLNQEVQHFQDFIRFLEEEELEDEDVEVVVDNDGRRRIRFSEQLLYAPGSKTFNPKVIPVLDRLGLILKKLGRRVEVEGHTDSTKGSQSNWLLSAMRASSVSRFLEATNAFGSDKISAIGYGSSQPRYGTGADTRNRRVEIVID
jgi:chemotaxis protein MotB